MAACIAALWFCYPLHFERAETEVLAWSDVYNAGDIGGTLFLARRAAVGEEGSWTHLLQAPDGLDLDLAREFPNLLPTDLIGWFVGQWGLPLGYGLALLALCVSNGLAVQLVARLLGAGRVAALAGGVFAATAPLVADELLSGRPVSAWWAPAMLAVGLGLAASERVGRMWLAVPAGLALWVAIESYAFAPVLLAGWAVVGVLVGGPWRWLRAGLVGIVAIAVAWPGVSGALEAAEGRRAALSTSFTLYDLPAGLDTLAVHELLSGAIGSGNLERLPATITVLGALGALIGWRRWKQWLPPLVGGVLVLLVAMGPQPEYGTEKMKPGRGVPYTEVMNAVPLLRAVPRPTRFGLAGVQLVALWAALAVSGRKRRWAWAGLAIGGAYAALVQTRPQQVDDTMPWPPVPGLGQVEGTELLLDLPLLMPEAQTTYLLTAAWPVPRVTPDATDFDRWLVGLNRTEHPLLMACAAIQRGQEVPDEVMAGLAEEIPEVEGLGLRRIVLHLKASEHKPNDWLRLLRDIGAEALYWDDEVVVYRIGAEG